MAADERVGDGKPELCLDARSMTLGSGTTGEAGLVSVWTWSYHKAAKLT